MSKLPATNFENWYLVMRAYDIPSHMHEGLARWIVDGIKPGSFLRSVISNDLRAAVVTADGINRNALVHYIEFLVNTAPDGCYGRPEVLNEWKGLRHVSR